MNGRDVPDLLTGLQDALNVAHDDDSRSRPRRVLHNACAKGRVAPSGDAPSNRPGKPTRHGRLLAACYHAAGASTGSRNQRYSAFSWSYANSKSPSAVSHGVALSS